MFSYIEKHLSTEWGLRISANTKEVLACKNFETRPVDDKDWKHVSSFSALGHVLDDDGGIRSDFDHTCRLMWAAFFRTHGKALKLSSIEAQANFLRACIRSIAAARWAKWPLQAMYVAKLDALQTSMLHCLLRCPRRAGEPDAVYFKRRRQLSKKHARASGLWSASWAQDTLNWKSHFERPRNKHGWSKSLFAWRDSKWLNCKRFLSGRWKDTGARVGRGNVAKRWEEGLRDANFYIQQGIARAS